MKQITKAREEMGEEAIKKCEANLVFLISQAENGNEQAQKTLKELDLKGAVCMGPEIILRLAEYYCLSLDTAGKAEALCKWLEEFDFDFEIEHRSICQLLSSVLNSWGERLFDRYDDEPLKGRMAILSFADGKLFDLPYAIAQYWVAKMAEKYVRCSLSTMGVEDALHYYKRAADQGLAVATSSLRELAIKNNYCPYCGGQFKGLFKMVCRKCGKPKDY